MGAERRGAPDSQAGGYRGAGGGEAGGDDRWRDGKKERRVGVPIRRFGARGVARQQPPPPDADARGDGGRRDRLSWRLRSPRRTRTALADWVAGRTRGKPARLGAGRVARDVSERDASANGKSVGFAARVRRRVCRDRAAHPEEDVFVRQPERLGRLRKLAGGQPARPPRRAGPERSVAADGVRERVAEAARAPQPVPQRHPRRVGGEPVRRRRGKTRAVGGDHRGGAPDRRRRAPQADARRKQDALRREGGHGGQQAGQFRGGRRAERRGGGVAAPGAVPAEIRRRGARVEAPPQDRGRQEARQRVIRARASPQRRRASLGRLAGLLAGLLASLLRAQPRQRWRRAPDQAVLLGGGARRGRRVPHPALRRGRLGGGGWGGGGGARAHSSILEVAFAFDGLQVTLCLAVGVAVAAAPARGTGRLGRLSRGGRLFGAVFGVRAGVPGIAVGESKQSATGSGASRVAFVVPAVLARRAGRLEEQESVGVLRRTGRRRRRRSPSTEAAVDLTPS